jgi:hypothetical protein
MGSGTSDTARRLGLLAVAAGLAAAIAIVGRRLAERGSPGGASAPEIHRCACGTTYRVTGVDRHRVYWRGDEPVVGDRCAECDAPLPAGHDVAAV